jgi:hypothetical protein
LAHGRSVTLNGQTPEGHKSVRQVISNFTLDGTCVRTLAGICRGPSFADHHAHRLSTRSLKRCRSAGGTDNVVAIDLE